MKPTEKLIDYNTTNSYTTMNLLSPATKNVWIVLHGIGYLSRYFLKYFNELSPEENYIIAPQAPSKYYLDGRYTHVGASWLTKENTAVGIENLVNYLDRVYASENISNHHKLIIFGFSQGVSVAARWVARSKVPVDHLVLYAGGMPKELTSADFEFMMDAEISVLVGDRDEYLTQERLKEESKKIKMLFQGRAKQIIFEGGHEIQKTLIHQLI